jgi:hypothetical protein
MAARQIERRGRGIKRSDGAKIGARNMLEGRYSPAYKAGAERPEGGRIYPPRGGSKGCR